MRIAGAGATYRDANNRAITAAFGAGALGKSIDDTQIIEAMGQHFLTNAFAAGHVSTPRGKIEKDWDARYPNFPYQLTNRIILDMVDFLLRTGENFGQYLRQKKVEAKVRKTLNETFAAKGQITLAKKIGLVAHDFDNDNLLWFVNHLGERCFGYGDGNLHRQPMGPRQKGEKTHREIIVLAVMAGIDDIRHACAIGQSGKKLAFPDSSDAVRNRPSDKKLIEGNVESGTILDELQGHRQRPEQSARLAGRPLPGSCKTASEGGVREYPDPAARARPGHLPDLRDPDRLNQWV
jgi:hypothetical protein